MSLLDCMFNIKANNTRVFIVPDKKRYGIIRVTKPPYSDPASLKKDWLAIDFEPVKTFSNPITLTKIKSEPLLKNTALVKQPRLSVMPLTPKEFDVIVKMGAPS